MSIILKTPGPDGKILLFSKGADSTITDKLSKNSSYLASTEKFLLNFARKGLRTLMIAYKELTNDEYFQWNNEINVRIFLIFLGVNYKRL